MQTRERIRNGVAAKHRGVGIPRDRPGQTGSDRGVVAKGDPVSTGRSPSVAGDAHPGETRPGRQQPPNIDAELGQRPGTRAVHDDIGRLEQAAQPSATGFGRQIQRHTLLTKIQEIEEARGAAARAVGAGAAFDLDHPGTRAPEKVRAQRTGPQNRKVDDAGKVAGSSDDPRSPGTNSAPDGRRRGSRDGDRHRKTEEPSPGDHLVGGAGADPICDEIPRIVGGVATEPRRQQIAIVGARQIDGDPTVAGGQQAAASAGSDAAPARQSENRRPLPEQRGPIEPGRPAVPSQMGQGLDTATRAGRQRSPDQPRRPIGASAQCHGPRARPLDRGVAGAFAVGAGGLGPNRNAENFRGVAEHGSGGLGLG